MKNSHCSYCGAKFEAALPFPRTCGSCGNTTYVNPIPVAVVLLPVDKGLLVIRRTIEPQKGRLALPGGFIDLNETWQQAAARELREETGLEISPDEISHFATHSAPDGTVLVFGLTQPRNAVDLPEFKNNAETSELAVCDQPESLGFPLHRLVAQAYFELKKGV